MYNFLHKIKMQVLHLTLLLQANFGINHTPLVPPTLYRQILFVQILFAQILLRGFVCAASFCAGVEIKACAFETTKSID